MKQSSVFRIGAWSCLALVAASVCHAQEPQGAVKRLQRQLQPPPPPPVQRQQLPPRQVNPAVNPAPLPAVQPAPPVQAAPAVQVQTDPQRIRQLTEQLKDTSKEQLGYFSALVELLNIGAPALPILQEAQQGGNARAGYVANLLQNPQQAAVIAERCSRYLQAKGVAVPAAAQPQAALQQGNAPDPAALPQLPAEPVAPAGPTLDLLETIGLKLVATKSGLVVAELKPDSPASRVGLAVGDVVHKVNDKILLGLDDAKLAFGQAQPGDVFGIEAARGAETFKLAMPIPKAGNW